ncbi:MAG: DUF669 domain-containing protein [Phycisphaerae bacterium]|nr:MAG: DUF669 domain-containing protein [Planctomycetota bacterium]KAB2937324.1 MAG: DUF669 domain-containing protein [Phycisphaerae bacterium]MBE7457152.1 DUF669 domain-containing protein [Planctomycetia bacterium]MCK6463489.1 DUF669 domain-containing protein [Phycisphaerae bacterium]MCL4718971.1 DUF669 domain-containing protein [Phycisphaerae bacterium]
MANLNFNATDVDPAVGYDPIPAGKYLAAITESEEKPTKSGSGSYVQLTFQILEGEYKGRLVWARLNLDNPNATAVKIARAELSAICRAVGVMSPKDSSELHNLPLVISVGVKPRKDNGEPSNVIRGYEKRGAAAKPPAAATGNGKAPWQR